MIPRRNNVTLRLPHGIRAIRGIRTQRHRVTELIREIRVRKKNPAAWDS